MATRSRTIRLDPASYELLAAEARRRGISPDEVAGELMRERLAGAGDVTERMRSALTTAAAVRASMPPIDGVELARRSREQLEGRE